MEQILKYPRTRHLESSKLQPGDEDLDQVPWSELAGKYLVLEEKIDGANTGISFDAEGEMHLQCRGHFLTGGAGEKQFALFKQWAATHADSLFDMLEDRYIMYGEWMYAKHTVFYDKLPHYFMEFDVFDRKTGIWLSTAARNSLLDRSIVKAVLVLDARAYGPDDLEVVKSNVGRSHFKTPEWKENLVKVAARAGQDSDRVLKETDPSDRMEGLYIKWEEGGQVLGRYKWIRPNFVQAILESGTHWKARPIIPNQLRDGTDIFARS